MHVGAVKCKWLTMSKAWYEEPILSLLLSTLINQALLLLGEQ